MLDIVYLPHPKRFACSKEASRLEWLPHWKKRILLFLLSAAMLKSPYHETLWLWLPAFGFVPLALFIINHRLTKTLIKSVLLAITVANISTHIMRAGTMKKSWVCPAIWMTFGMLSVIFFTLGLRCLDSSIN